MKPDKLNPTLPLKPSTLDEDDFRELTEAELLEDDREPTKAELLEDLRIALRDAMAGYTGQDAMEFLDELEREARVDADQS